MAQRRMFSKAIISSARFLKMPSDSQNLYFHLGLNADDDGIVEAFSIMRIVGCNEDNLDVLIAKGFIKILNDDLVTFITDWKEHNLIRADRKVDSIYKNLLLQIMPETILLESKPRADLKKSVDVQMTTNGQHRLGKVSIGKDSLEECSVVKDLEEKEISKKEVRHRYGEYKHVLLTDKEYDSLLNYFNHNDKDLKYWIKEVDDGIQQKGYKYKDFNLTIRKWHEKYLKDSKPKQAQPEKAEQEWKRLEREEKERLEREQKGV